MTFVDNLDFVIAGILAEKVKWAKHRLVLFAGLIPAADVGEAASQAGPDKLTVRLGDMRRVVLHFLGTATWLADLFAVREEFSNFFAAVKKMRLELTVQFGA